MKDSTELAASLHKSKLPAVHFSGYRPVYTSGCNCPGCGRSQWDVRRATAECVFCHTALPLPDSEPSRTAQIIFSDRFRPSAHRGAFTINGKAA